MDLNKRKRVVIVGGGFGGIHAARALKGCDVSVALIDKRNFHLFQPLLYQVATGGLSPANIAAPIRRILYRQRNVSVMLGDVCKISPNEQLVEFISTKPGELSNQTQTMPYDWLVIAAGATHSYFGHDQWRRIAPGLKTIEDATRIRGRIFEAFEAAEYEQDPELRNELMTFVVVGGGPTGVELAGAIAELAKNTLRNDFRNIDPADAKIIIVDGQQRVLSNFVPELSNKAEQSLKRLGIAVLTNSLVTQIDEESVTIKSAGKTQTIRARTTLWAAGVAGAPLGRQLAAAAGIEPDAVGRIPVLPDLSIAGFPNIFVIGDLARVEDKQGNVLPGVAQVAIQQGKFVGRSIVNAVTGKTNKTVFAYKDKGSLATIGRRAAVADLGWYRSSGLFAWLLWVVVHIMTLAQFQNKLLVFLQWSWNYFTFNRSARLITERKKPGQDDRVQ